MSILTLFGGGPTTQPGYRSLLAHWAGGASATADAQPFVPGTMSNPARRRVAMVAAVVTANVLLTTFAAAQPIRPVDFPNPQVKAKANVGFVSAKPAYYTDAATQPGYTSLLSFWSGGAASTEAEEETPDTPTPGGADPVLTRLFWNPSFVTRPSLSLLTATPATKPFSLDLWRNPRAPQRPVAVGFIGYYVGGDEPTFPAGSALSQPVRIAPQKPVRWDPPPNLLTRSTESQPTASLFSIREWPTPPVRKRAVAQGWQVARPTYYQDQAPPIVGMPGQTLPRAKGRPNVGFTVDRPFYYPETGDPVDPIEVDAPNPGGADPVITIQTYRFGFVSGVPLALSTAASATKPFNFEAWPTPPAPKRAVAQGVQAQRPQFYADQFPVGVAGATPNQIGKGRPNVGFTHAKPAFYVDGAVQPGLRSLLAFWAGGASNYGDPPVVDPFRQDAWPTPRSPKRPVAQGFQAYYVCENETLVPHATGGADPIIRRPVQRLGFVSAASLALTSTPVVYPSGASSAPERVAAIRSTRPTDPPNLLTGTLAPAPDTKPFNFEAWPTPPAVKRSVAQGIQAERPAYYVETIPIGAAQFTLPTVRVARFGLVIQTSTPIEIATPFVPVAFPNPQPRKVALDTRQPQGYRVEPDPPFTPVLFPNPRLKAPIDGLRAQVSAPSRQLLDVGAPFVPVAFPNPLIGAPQTLPQPFYPTVLYHVYAVTPDCTVVVREMVGEIQVRGWPSVIRVRRIVGGTQL